MTGSGKGHCHSFVTREEAHDGSNKKYICTRWGIQAFNTSMEETAMRSIIFAFVSAAILTVMPASVWAGGYADGFGTTPEEAIKSARDGAQKAVDSRGGRGCVGPGKNGEKELVYVGKDKDLYYFQAFFNHTNGACGKQKAISDIIKEVGLSIR
jgi:hypothetical protein